MMALVILTTACQNKKQETEETAEAEPAKSPVTLQLKWETDTLLTTCESVLYDEAQDVLYVSNINGDAGGKDGNGFISKVSTDGKVTEQHWAKGLDAPKGMGLSNGKLYVADIDKVIEIDTQSGKITHTYAVEGAAFLNDITVDNSGKVYISDSRGGSIYILENGTVSAWITGLDGPNGLFADGDKMMMGLFSGKSFNSIDVASKQVTLLTDSIENADGVEAIGNGAYLVSSWNGMVHYIDAGGNETLVLDTRADSVSAADIEYISSKNLLLVPTFFKNKVMAYEVIK